MECHIHLSRPKKKDGPLCFKVGRKNTMENKVSRPDIEYEAVHLMCRGATKYG